MDSNNHDDEVAPEPSLQNVFNQNSLKWIFVGGKGGVGKTTCSCSLAIQLAKVRESVLLLSTDPAHNISDAFGQKFTKEPIIVEGFDNLYAMEIDPDAETNKIEQILNGMNEFISPNMKEGLVHFLKAYPGVGESLGYSRIFKMIEGMKFSVVVIDTAPTGHTLRLLAFPLKIKSSIEKLLALKNNMGPLLNQVFLLFGININIDNVARLLEEWLAVLENISKQFKSSDLTTFICVCIAEFLSLYETERLIQELTSHGIDTHNVVVNQLITDIGDSDCCKKCSSRQALQNTYLEQISDLYFDFHVTKIPLMEKEVRGITDISELCKYLVNPNAFFKNDKS